MDKALTFREQRRARIALAVGLMIMVATLVATMSRRPLVAVGSNSIPPEGVIATTRGGNSACQKDEVLPAGTSAMRLWVSVNIGPRVTVTALSGARVVTRGTRGAGWTGEVVTVPVKRVPRTISHARVCFAIGPAVEKIGLVGAKVAGKSEKLVKMRIEYMRPGPRSWWSLASSVARHMGLDRAPSGTWIVLIPLALMTAAVVLTSWLVLRQLGSPRGAGAAPIAGAQVAPPPVAPEHSARKWPARSGGLALRMRAGLRRVPTAAWACAGVACLSAASWSIVTPPFQVPDEPSHVAYAQQLAETGRLPTSSSSRYAPAELATLEALNHLEVRFNPVHGEISSPAQRRRLEENLAQPLPRVGEGAAGVATSEPPLYYALLTIPYRLASRGNLLDQLALMRLVSALMAGLSALFAFLFLREALPATPWAWTVGGLGVALYPLLGFMSGVVNPDSMLCAVSAAVFYCLARAFRRGLTTRLAVAIGVLMAVGFMTKLNFLGLAPGLLLALAVLTFRAVRSTGRSAYRLPVLALAIGGSPVFLYVLVNMLSHHASLGLASDGIGRIRARGTLLDELVFIWQFYLPRLPGMASDFPGLSPMRHIWFDRSVGLYGWLDTYFPEWVYNVALIPAGVIVALCARALVQSRSALRGRLPELLVYTVMGVGVIGLVGANSYFEFPGRSGGFSEPRYLLPMAALFGAVLALAARGAGRRWGPAVGALIVVLILSHDIFSQLLSVSRFYR
jgi:hypothetical protein